MVQYTPSAAYMQMMLLKENRRDSASKRKEETFVRPGCKGPLKVLDPKIAEHVAQQMQGQYALGGKTKVDQER